MATTITPQSLVVTLSEVITLNGQPINSENSFTVPVVNEIDKRILTVPSSEEISIINLDSATSAGTFIRSNIRYIRIVNKDSTNFVRIRVTVLDNDTFDIKLEAGKFFIINNGQENTSDTQAAFSGFQNYDEIRAQADTAPVDIEYYVASV